jgi:phage baseplate assembly protein gpV
MEHGTVTTVNYEDGAVYCDVRAIRLNNEYQNVPVLKTHSGFVQVPEQGMTVAMDKLRDGTRFITHVISKENDTPSNVQEGDIILQLDSDTVIEVSKAGGNYDVTIGASGKLDLTATGTLSLKAGKKLTIDSDTAVEIQGIPFADHTHPHDDSTINDTSDGSGSKSTTSKDTGKPQ